MTSNFTVALSIRDANWLLPSNGYERENRERKIERVAGHTLIFAVVAAVVTFIGIGVTRALAVAEKLGDLHARQQVKVSTEFRAALKELADG